MQIAWDLELKLQPPNQESRKHETFNDHEQSNHFEVLPIEEVDTNKSVQGAMLAEWISIHGILFAPGSGDQFYKRPDSALVFAVFGFRTSEIKACN